MNLMAKIKTKYSLIGLVVVPIFGRLALSGTGHEGDLYRYIVPAFVGCLAGFFIGREHSRYILKQQKLLESEESFRSITENTSLLVCRFRHDNVITYVNKSFCNYFDKTSKELIGSSFLNLVPQADRESVMVNLSLMTVDSPNQSHEHQVFGSNGETRWTHWTNSAQFDSQGKPDTYQSIGEDISDRMKAEAVLTMERERLAVTLHSIGDGVLTTDIKGHVTLLN